MPIKQVLTDKLVVIAEFVLMYRFTSFFIRLAGPIPGAGRDQENPYEGHEARFASSPRGKLEACAWSLLGERYSA